MVTYYVFKDDIFICFNFGSRKPRSEAQGNPRPVLMKFPLWKKSKVVPRFFTALSKNRSPPSKSACIRAWMLFFNIYCNLFQWKFSFINLMKNSWRKPLRKVSKNIQGSRYNKLKVFQVNNKNVIKTLACSLLTLNTFGVLNLYFCVRCEHVRSGWVAQG